MSNQFYVKIFQDADTLLPSHFILSSFLSVPTGSPRTFSLIVLKNISRYWNEDILLHEFAHGVEDLGAAFAIPLFRTKKKAMFDECKINGKWKGEYSMTSPQEYWVSIIILIRFEHVNPDSFFAIRTCN